MSRELDARVAEKVMGWSQDYCSKVDDAIWVSPKGEIAKVKLPESLNYSTDHNAAFEVINKITSGISIVAHVNFDGVDSNWNVCLENINWESVFSQTHTSFPIAICLAALRAKGDDKWVEQYLKELV